MAVGHQALAALPCALGIQAAINQQKQAAGECDQAGSEWCCGKQCTQTEPARADEQCIAQPAKCHHQSATWRRSRPCFSTKAFCAPMAIIKPVEIRKPLRKGRMVSGYWGHSGLNLFSIQGGKPQTLQVVRQGAETCIGSKVNLLYQLGLRWHNDVGAWPVSFRKSKRPSEI